MEKRGRNQFFFLSYLTYRETVHKTQPFGKLKQTLSKELQDTCYLTVESVIERLTPSQSAPTFST